MIWSIRVSLGLSLECFGFEGPTDWKQRQKDWRKKTKRGATFETLERQPFVLTSPEILLPSKNFFFSDEKERLKATLKWFSPTGPNEPLIRDVQMWVFLVQRFAPFQSICQKFENMAACFNRCQFPSKVRRNMPIELLVGQHLVAEWSSLAAIFIILPLMARNVTVSPLCLSLSLLLACWGLSGVLNSF